MGKTVFYYGFALAAVALLLSWLDYRFWMRGIGLEVYGLVIALLFGGLGVWIERQRQTRPDPVPHKKNEKAIKALGLTAREVEMLDFLRKGKSNKEIARDLGLSPFTIKTHMKNLYEKMGVKNRTQAVSQAVDLGLYSPE